ncbi:MAG TPA: phosphoribosyltransferase family protein [Candidatus Doudnabacteria bacterium]|nr:phosphoribosyltransferase family protein [Candidatus Doudnabacteria bacterium]
MIDEIEIMIKDLVFPKQCFGCRTWGNFICCKCETQIKVQAFQRCIVCQKASLNGWTHPKCKKKYTPERLITIFDYHSKMVSNLINTGKSALVPEIFSDLAFLAARKIIIRDELRWKYVLCPIPQTKSKARWRGFNHAELIAKVFSKQLNLAINKILTKSKTTRQQKELNKEQRASNLQSAFKVSLISIPNQVILIDDITTTGSTFLEATRVLKRAGVKSVWCLAIAQD